MNPVAIVLFLERKNGAGRGNWVRQSNCALCPLKKSSEKNQNRLKKDIGTKLIGRLKTRIKGAGKRPSSGSLFSGAMGEDRPPSGSGGGGVPPEKGGYEENSLNSNANGGGSSSSAAEAATVETLAQAADNDEPQALFDLNSGAAVVFAAVMILLHLFKGDIRLETHF
jgi:hypothetical protein